MRREGLDGHTSLGFVFNSTLTLVEQRAGLDAALRLLNLFFKRRPVDFLRYPAQSFLGMVDEAARLLSPNTKGSHTEALRLIGSTHLESFFATMMGKTLLTLVGKGAPNRLMSSAPTAYATTFSWGERSYEAVGDTGGRLRQRQDPMPVAYHEGLLLAALRVVEVRNPQVKGSVTGPDSADYVMQWE